MTPAAPEPSTPDEVDVIVLGGGPVGENAAQYAIEDSDLTAIVVERELMGGECSYYACMPSKALLRPIDVADVSADLPGVGTASVERESLLARRDEWVSHYDDSSQVQWAEDTGITVVRGHGRLAGERIVEVATRGGPRAPCAHAGPWSSPQAAVRSSSTSCGTRCHGTRATPPASRRSPSRCSSSAAASSRARPRPG